ncbi:MAG: hypothetical protein ACRDYX_22165, partial [Egibacteraceae bacterium]
VRLHLPNLAFDIDTPDDLHALNNRLPPPQTAAKRLNATPDPGPRSRRHATEHARNMFHDVGS